MKKPYPYGIPKGATLSEKTLTALKVDIVLADMQIADYTDLDKVIDRYFAFQQSDDPETAFKTIVTFFTKISKSHRNISIKNYVDNVKKYYHAQKTQFSFIYTQKLELLKKDIENKHAADIVGAEEIGRGILRGKKRMAEQSANILQVQQKVLKTSSSTISSPPSTTSFSSTHYNSTAPFSSPISRFLNPNEEVNINIDEAKAIIKNEAKLLHNLFVEGAEIEPALFKRMSIGLSSIIDFGDTDEDSQKVILSQRWDSLYEHFKYVYKTRKYHLPLELKNTWALISVFCLKNNSTTKAKDYLRKMIDVEYKKKSPSSETLRILNVFDFMLNLYDENAWIFDENQKKSEMDFLSVVWKPLLRKMTYIHNNIILVKGGECTNPYTQFMKSVLYNTQKKIIGHKIDIRFVVNDADEEDIDVAKLLVEAKDIVDLMVNNTIHIEDIRTLSGTGFQIGVSFGLTSYGLACQTSSVYLYRPQVYVALPRFSFEIPSTIESLRSFENTFESIMTLILEMEEKASLIKKSKDFFNRDRRSFRFTSPNPTDEWFTDYSNWVAASWYPPVKKDRKKSKVPEDHIFTTTTNEATTSTTSTANATPFEYDRDLVDEFGWVQVAGGFYNVEVDLLLEKHPLSQEEN